MVVEIEYFKGDTLLYGTGISFDAFRKQVQTAEQLCDKDADNFVALLCRMYSWEICGEPARPQYVYDRDIQKCRRAGAQG